MSDALLAAGMVAFAVGTFALGLGAAGVVPPQAGPIGVGATILGGVLVIAGAILGGSDDVPTAGEERDRERESE